MVHLTELWNLTWTLNFYIILILFSFFTSIWYLFTIWEVSSQRMYHKLEVLVCIVCQDVCLLLNICSQLNHLTNKSHVPLQIVQNYSYHFARNNATKYVEDDVSSHFSRQFSWVNVRWSGSCWVNLVVKCVDEVRWHFVGFELNWWENAIM